ncbi:MAG: glycosyltransferase family 4 protein [Chlorobium sp.]|nr:MAG: glycosyltransferase family 4 protein [Chlorobium sp.]
MRLALIADAYPPMRSSGAVQLRDLSKEFLRQGFLTTVLVPSAELDVPWLLEEMNGVQVLRLKAPQTKDIGYVRRTACELLMPFMMLRNLQKSPLAKESWDGVVWYSPTIFLGPIVNVLKKASKCRSYLIIRDIFPEWAVDMGLLSRGLAYRFFKVVESYQYSVADVIGVQTLANLSYFDHWMQSDQQRLEVLQNWLADEPDTGCSIVVAEGPLAGRKIFVYAGNMGVAQGMDVLLDLAENLQGRKDIGFLFVGRGHDAERLRSKAETSGLNNVVFYDEIDPAEIPGLYAQCHIGLVALDTRHKTHNIPGKFLSYMQYGLPVLATINPGNDLEALIKTERVGRVCSDASAETLLQQAEELLNTITVDSEISSRCKSLSARLFSPKVAVNQIISALRSPK